MMNEQPKVTKRINLRAMVRGAYDLQKLRIQMGNRIVANYRSKMGQEPGTKEADTMDAEGKSILKRIRLSYKRITDGVVGLPRRKSFVGDELISSYAELCLVDQYEAMDKTESRAFRKLTGELEEFPIWNEFLVNVRGVGPAMGGVIVSELDPHKAKHPSSFWKYAGLDTGPDGKGRSRRAEHLVERTYLDKNGHEQVKRGITYNPFLKARLLNGLALSFMKVPDCPYRDIYDGYKLRLQSRTDFHQEGQKGQKGHVHNAALRYMVKMFLIDLHMKWRALEGLTVSLPYHEAKLHMKHGPE